MPDSHDPLRSLFQDAASAGQAATTLAPVSAIARRGERVRRRRIAGAALACLLVLAGSGAAIASFLPGERSPVLPATTPSPRTPSPEPTGSAPPRNTLPPPDPSGTAGPGGKPDPGGTTLPGASATSTRSAP